jgi:hypothetical protein
MELQTNDNVTPLKDRSNNMPLCEISPFKTVDDRNTSQYFFKA